MKEFKKDRLTVKVMETRTEMGRGGDAHADVGDRREVPRDHSPAQRQRDAVSRTGQRGENWLLVA